MLRKILLVEDDAILRRFLKNALCDQGYSVKSFASPHEAHKYMDESADYDAAIFDAKYENEDYSVFNLITISKGYNPSAPIIVLSGYDSPESLLKSGWVPGILKWMVKPVGIEEIPKTFDDYFKLNE